MCGQRVYGVEERFKLHAHYCLKNAKISASCEENKVQMDLASQHIFSVIVVSKPVVIISCLKSDLVRAAKLTNLILF